MTIIFIGKDKPTNQAIIRRLNEHLDCVLHCIYDPENLFTSAVLVPKNADMVIYDTTSFTGNIVSRIKKISEFFGRMPLLALHPYDKEKLVEPLLKNGANGVITNSPNEQVLMESVNNLLRGRTYLQKYKKA